MPGKRRIFVVGWNNGIDFAMYCDSEPISPVAQWLQLIPAAVNAQATAEDEKVEVLVPGSNCLLFDWALEELPADVRVNQVPKPGVVFAVRKGSRMEEVEQPEKPEDSDADAQHGETAKPGGDQVKSEVVPNAEPTKDSGSSSRKDGGEYTLVYLLKRDLWRGESKPAKRLQAFISAPEADYEPLPITRYDAFISYRSEDLALATEIAADLEARSMRTFLASRNLATGMVWTEEVRQALLASRVLLIVLTPNSATRPWVMCEVGASWALGKPLIPALLYVDPKTLPEVITSYQCRRIETVQGRKALVEELAELCLVGT